MHLIRHVTESVSSEIHSRRVFALQRARSREPLQSRAAARIPRKTHKETTKRAATRTTGAAQSNISAQDIRSDVDPDKRQRAMSNHRGQLDDCAQAKRGHVDVPFQEIASAQIHRGRARSQAEQVRIQAQ